MSAPDFRLPDGQAAPRRYFVKAVDGPEYQEQARLRIAGAVRVHPISGCWEWSRSLTSEGYGHLYYLGRKEYAHRIAWRLWVGPIPDELELDHLCRNRSCCYPAHLEPVTHRTNLRRGIPGMATHCVNGHEFTPENTRRRKEGRRQCRACDRIRQRKYNQLKQAPLRGEAS